MNRTAELTPEKAFHAKSTTTLPPLPDGGYRLVVRFSEESGKKLLEFFRQLVIAEHLREALLRRLLPYHKELEKYRANFIKHRRRGRTALELRRKITKAFIYLEQASEAVEAGKQESFNEAFAKFERQVHLLKGAGD